MSMIKVSSSRLKAKLGQYMRAVRQGKSVLVTDRDEPVARLVPIDSDPQRGGVVAIRPRDPTAPPLGRVQVRGLRTRGIDTMALLLEDRARR